MHTGCQSVNDVSSAPNTVKRRHHSVCRSILELASTTQGDCKLVIPCSETRTGSRKTQATEEVRKLSFSVQNFVNSFYFLKPPTECRGVQIQRRQQLLIRNSLWVTLIKTIFLMKQMSDEPGLHSFDLVLQTCSSRCRRVFQAAPNLCKVNIQQHRCHSCTPWI